MQRIGYKFFSFTFKTNVAVHDFFFCILRFSCESEAGQKFARHTGTDSVRVSLTRAWCDLSKDTARASSSFSLSSAFKAVIKAKESYIQYVLVPPSTGVHVLRSYYFGTITTPLCGLRTCPN